MMRRGRSAQRNAAAALAAVLLVGLLTACSSLLPDTFERDVPKAIAAADVGAVGVDTSTHWEGFSKAITIRVEFGSAPVTDTQFRNTLAAVSSGLGVNAGSRLLVTFKGPEHQEAAGIEAAVESLNQELGLSGDQALDGGSSMLLFSSGKDLQSLVKEMRKAGML